MIRSIKLMHIFKTLQADNVEKGWWKIINRRCYFTVFPFVKMLKNWRDSWYVVKVPKALRHRFTAPLRFQRPKPNKDRLEDIPTGPHERKVLRGFSSKRDDKHVAVPALWLHYNHFLQQEKVLALGGLSHQFTVDKYLG